jgi:hypothetical protein
MNPQQAAENLEAIRTLMERTCQYQFLTARASLVAGSLATGGALAFWVFDPANPWHFGTIWALVFVGSLMATVTGTVLRSQASGERLWSRQARTVVLALTPSLVSALILTIFFFALGWHQWLPGIWMLCYAQGALATSTYAPAPIRWIGRVVLILGGPALWLGPNWSAVLMGLVFGVGHLTLGTVLLIQERRQKALKIHRIVA